MTWWMVALLAYFLPMAISIALVSEYGIWLGGKAIGVFIPIGHPCFNCKYNSQTCPYNRKRV